MGIEKRLFIIRDYEDEERTIGKLFVGKNKWIAETMEPGTKEYRLPAGFYICKPHGWEPNTAFRYKKTYAIIGDDVSHQPEVGIGHSAVVFHRGVRDEHSEGCVLLGSKRGISRGEQAILEIEPGEAVERLRQIIGGPYVFFLTIKDVVK